MESFADGRLRLLCFYDAVPQVLSRAAAAPASASKVAHVRPDALRADVARGPLPDEPDVVYRPVLVELPDAVDVELEIVLRVLDKL